MSFNACAKALERGSLWQLAVDLFEKLTEALEPDACLVCDFWCQLMSVCHPTVYWVYRFFFFSNLAPEHFLKILKSGQFFICPLAQDSPIVEVLHHIAPTVQVPSVLVKRSEWILNSEAELWHRFEQLGERSLSGKHRGYISGFQE